MSELAADQLPDDPTSDPNDLDLGYVVDVDAWVRLRKAAGLDRNATGDVRGPIQLLHVGV